MNEKERIESAKYIMSVTYYGIQLSTDQYCTLFKQTLSLLEQWAYELERAA